MNPFGDLASGAATLLKKTAQVFQGNDAEAQSIGRQGDGLVTRCARLVSFSWKLTLRVTGQTNTRYDRLQNATAEVAWSQGTEDVRPLQMSSPGAGQTSVINGSKPHAGICTAEAAGWYLESQKRVAIDDGEIQYIDLVLKPLPWVAIDVVDHESGDRVLGVHISTESKKYKEAVAPLVAPLPDDSSLEYVERDPGSTLKIVEMSHPNILFEAVGEIVSADR